MNGKKPNSIVTVRAGERKLAWCYSDSWPDERLLCDLLRMALRECGVDTYEDGADKLMDRLLHLTSEVRVDLERIEDAEMNKMKEKCKDTYAVILRAGRHELRHCEACYPGEMSIAWMLRYMLKRLRGGDTSDDRCGYKGLLNRVVDVAGEVSIYIERIEG